VIDVKSILKKSTYGKFGLRDKSKTCRGLRSQENFFNNLGPIFPPLFGLMKTRRGLDMAGLELIPIVGDLIMNAFVVCRKEGCLTMTFDDSS